MGARFVPNPNFERQARESREMKTALKRAAEVAAEEARRLAPVGTGERRPAGTYRDSIHVEGDGDDVRVVADDAAASWIEFGTEDTPAFAPLRRGTEAAGLKTSGGKR